MSSATTEVTRGEEAALRVTPRQTKGGRSYAHLGPSQKSRSKLMERVREVLNQKTQGKASGEVIDEINSVMKGWGGTFSYGHGKTVFNRMHDLISERLRTWLWKNIAKANRRLNTTRGPD